MIRRNLTLIFPSRESKNLFIKEVLPRLQSEAISAEVIDKEAPAAPVETPTKGSVRRGVTKLRSETEVWETLKILISSGTLTILIAKVRDVLIKYIEMSKTTIFIEVDNKRVLLEYHRTLNLKEALTDETIRGLLAPPTESTE